MSTLLFLALTACSCTSCALAELTCAAAQDFPFPLPGPALGVHLFRCLYKQMRAEVRELCRVQWRQMILIFTSSFPSLIVEEVARFGSMHAVFCHLDSAEAHAGKGNLCLVHMAFFDLGTCRCSSPSLRSSSLLVYR